ncbi:DUF6565 domain-containing protein [Flavobacterium adhaerens]|uniref:DUF6565 domain-containing protein n=1 Tax=Flavobacterium adhaerens TaxID=3149043 RepID=UPI0032B35C80
MKNIKTTLVAIAIVLAFASCKDEKQEKAQKAIDKYKTYIDSVSNVAQDELTENWEKIESNYDKLKLDAETSLANATDKTKLQSSLDALTDKYGEFKTKIISDSKTEMHKALLGPNYVSDDMQFNWVNKDNILSVYDNFVTTVEKNKDSYSREDWDEIKLVYEALDTRKNTVEKEGLSASDNAKIAKLKLRFAPMYTIKRLETKSDENADAKN